VAHTSDGFLIFTTHGERSRVKFGNPTIGADSFWFKPESGQQDLPGNEYGSAITLPAYVLGQFAGIPDMRIVRFQEGFWWCSALQIRKFAIQRRHIANSAVGLGMRTKRINRDPSGWVSGRSPPASVK
jgi:hypothetical protein